MKPKKWKEHPSLEKRGSASKLNLSSDSKSDSRICIGSNVTKKLYWAQQKLLPVIEDVMENATKDIMQKKQPSYSLTLEQYKDALAASKILNEVDAIFEGTTDDPNLQTPHIVSSLNLEKQPFHVDESGKVTINTSVLAQLVELYNVLGQIINKIQELSSDSASTSGGEGHYAELSDNSSSQTRAIHKQPVRQNYFVYSQHTFKQESLPNNNNLTPVEEEISASDPNLNSTATKTTSLGESETFRVTDADGARKIIIKCLEDLEKVKSYLEISKDLENTHLQGPKSSTEAEYCRCLVYEDGSRIEATLNGKPVDVALDQIELDDKTSQIVISLKGNNQEADEIKIVVKQCSECMQLKPKEALESNYTSRSEASRTTEPSTQSVDDKFPRKSSLKGVGTPDSGETRSKKSSTSEGEERRSSKRMPSSGLTTETDDKLSEQSELDHLVKFLEKEQSQQRPVTETQETNKLYTSGIPTPASSPAPEDVEELNLRKGLVGTAEFGQMPPGESLTGPKVSTGVPESYTKIDSAMKPQDASFLESFSKKGSMDPTMKSQGSDDKQSRKSAGAPESYPKKGSIDLAMKSQGSDDKQCRKACVPETCPKKGSIDSTLKPQGANALESFTKKGSVDLAMKSQISEDKQSRKSTASSTIHAAVPVKESNITSQTDERQMRRPSLIPSIKLGDSDEKTRRRSAIDPPIIIIEDEEVPTAALPTHTGMEQIQSTKTLTSIDQERIMASIEGDRTESLILHGREETGSAASRESCLEKVSQEDSRKDKPENMEMILNPQLEQEERGSINVIFNPIEPDKSIVQPPSPILKRDKQVGANGADCAEVKLNETTNLCFITDDGQEIVISLSIKPKSSLKQQMISSRKGGKSADTINDAILQEIFDDESEMPQKDAKVSDQTEIKPIDSKILHGIFDEPKTEEPKEDNVKESKSFIALPRVRVCSSLEFDVSVANTKMRETGINHLNQNVVIQLREFGVNNLLRASRPAKCCRKAILGEKARKCLPYPISLHSLPLEEDDVEIIKESYRLSIAKENKLKENNDKIVYFANLTIHFPSNLLWYPNIISSYQICNCKVIYPHHKDKPVSHETFNKLSAKNNIFYEGVVGDAIKWAIHKKLKYYINLVNDQIEGNKLYEIHYFEIKNLETKCPENSTETETPASSHPSVNLKRQANKKLDDSNLLKPLEHVGFKHDQNFIRNRNILCNHYPMKVNEISQNPFNFPLDVNTNKPKGFPKVSSKIPIKIKDLSPKERKRDRKGYCFIHQDKFEYLEGDIPLMPDIYVASLQSLPLDEYQETSGRAPPERKTFEGCDSSPKSSRKSRKMCPKLDIQNGPPKQVSKKIQCDRCASFLKQINIDNCSNVTLKEGQVLSSIENQETHFHRNPFTMSKEEYDSLEEFMNKLLSCKGPAADSIKLDRLSPRGVKKKRKILPRSKSEVAVKTSLNLICSNRSFATQTSHVYNNNVGSFIKNFLKVCEDKLKDLNGKVHGTPEPALKYFTRMVYEEILRGCNEKLDKYKEIIDLTNNTMDLNGGVGSSTSFATTIYCPFMMMEQMENRSIKRPKKSRRILKPVSRLFSQPNVEAGMDTKENEVKLNLHVKNVNNAGKKLFVEGCSNIFTSRTEHKEIQASFSGSALSQGVQVFFQPNGLTKGLQYPEVVKTKTTYTDTKMQNNNNVVLTSRMYNSTVHGLKKAVNEDALTKNELKMVYGANDYGKTSSYETISSICEEKEDPNLSSYRNYLSREQQTTEDEDGISSPQETAHAADGMVVLPVTLSPSSFFKRLKNNFCRSFNSDKNRNTRYRNAKYVNTMNTSVISKAGNGWIVKSTQCQQSACLDEYDICRICGKCHFEPKISCPSVPQVESCRKFPICRNDMSYTRTICTTEDNSSFFDNCECGEKSSIEVLASQLVISIGTNTEVTPIIDGEVQTHPEALRDNFTQTSCYVSNSSGKIMSTMRICKTVDSTRTNSTIMPCCCPHCTNMRQQRFDCPHCSRMKEPLSCTNDVGIFCGCNAVSNTKTLCLFSTPSRPCDNPCNYTNQRKSNDTKENSRKPNFQVDDDDPGDKEKQNRQQTSPQNSRDRISKKEDEEDRPDEGPGSKTMKANESKMDSPERNIHRKKNTQDNSPVNKNKESSQTDAVGLQNVASKNKMLNIEKKPSENTQGNIDSLDRNTPRNKNGQGNTPVDKPKEADQTRDVGPQNVPSKSSMQKVEGRPSVHSDKELPVDESKTENSLPERPTMDKIEEEDVAATDREHEARIPKQDHRKAEVDTLDASKSKTSPSNNQIINEEQAEVVTPDSSKSKTNLSPTSSVSDEESKKNETNKSQVMFLKMVQQQSSFSGDFNNDIRNDSSLFAFTKVSILPDGSKQFQLIGVSPISSSDVYVMEPGTSKSNTILFEPDSSEDK